MMAPLHIHNRNTTSTTMNLQDYNSRIDEYVLETTPFYTNMKPETDGEDEEDTLCDDLLKNHDSVVDVDISSGSSSSSSSSCRALQPYDPTGTSTLMKMVEHHRHLEEAVPFYESKKKAHSFGGFSNNSNGILNSTRRHILEEEEAEEEGHYLTESGSYLSSLRHHRRHLSVPCVSSSLQSLEQTLPIRRSNCEAHLQQLYEERKSRIGELFQHSWMLVSEIDTLEQDVQEDEDSCDGDD